MQLKSQNYMEKMVIYIQTLIMKKLRDVLLKTEHTFLMTIDDSEHIRNLYENNSKVLYSRLGFTVWYEQYWKK